jgi:hypothetical protein
MSTHLRRLAPWSAALLLALAACGPGADAVVAFDEPRASIEGEELPDEALDGLEHEDCVLAPPAGEYATLGQGLADGTPQVVYVNFDGPHILPCATCSDAPNNRSLVPPHLGHPNGYSFQPYQNAARKTAIVNFLQAWFGPYHVTFTTTRPASGPYTMLVISPSTPTTGSRGIAPLDCGNMNRDDIAFVYRVGDARRFPNAKSIAKAAAHELGHSFGLAHVRGTSQIMHYASAGDRFGAAPYDTAHPSGKCFSGNRQDAPALLRANLGVRP